LKDALDILHTQVMENLGEEHPALDILGKAMCDLSELD
jgi:hypothetical protein